MEINTKHGPAHRFRSPSLADGEAPDGALFGLGGVLPLGCSVLPGQPREAPGYLGAEGQRTVRTTDGDIASHEWSIPGPHRT